MAEAIEITPEMRAQIGVESDPWPYEVSAAGVRAFARGVGYRDPVYYESGAACAAGYPQPPPDPVLPRHPGLPARPVRPGFLHPAGYRAAPPLRPHRGPGCRTEAVYERPLLAGETLMARHRLVDLQVKRSRSLGAMLVVTTETSFRDGDGKLAAPTLAAHLLLGRRTP